MVVQFSGDAQGTTPKAGGQHPPGSPEQVRKKWDALLNVINNVSADGVDASGSAAASPPLRAARELVTDVAGKSPEGGRRKEWNNRHHLMYSVCNARMQKNIRSYFDRPRDIESYGLRYDEPLRTVWQLETPEEPPALGTMRGHFAKFNTPQSSPSRGGLLPAIGDAEASPQSTGMSKTMSDPSFHKSRENAWNGRHHIVFAKDNHHYHGNLREYFERPRAVLW